MINKKKMSEIVEISIGYQFRKDPPVFSQGTIPYIQMRDIDNNNEIDENTVINIDVDTNDNKFKSKALKQGDILFKNRGSVNTAVVFNMKTKTAIPSHQFQIIRIKDTSVVLSEYLRWYINNDIAQAYLKSNSTGTTTQIVQKKVLENMNLIIPSINEQRAIVKIDSLLSKYKNLMKRQMELYSISINSILSNYLNSNEDK